MSLIVGIYSLNKDRMIEDKDKNFMLETIGQSDSVVESYSEKGFFLAKADIGAFKETSFLKEKDGHVSALAGDAILRPPSNQGRSRMSVLKEISSFLKSGNKSVLHECQGLYNLCWYDIHTRLLLLSTDKIGVRPLYYYMDNTHLYFSGNLGVLEKLNCVSKRLDLIGLTERAILGSFLGRRTPYADIKVLRGGECLEIKGPELNISQYIKWDNIPLTTSSTDELIEQVYTVFNQAVSARAWRDDLTFSFLSGGMDSRAIITSLWGMKKKLFCGNLSFPGSQDAVYAKEYADVLGVKFYGFERGVNDKFMRNRIQGMMSSLISEVIEKEDTYPQFSQLILSGEGGSVGLGHVYMNEDIVAQMRNGNVEDVASELMGKKYLPKYLLKKNIISQVKSAIREDLLKELKSSHAEDPARNFYIFLISNDQRCHMMRHFEDILSHRLEFLAPFYDGRLLELILSTPIDICLRHRFYNKLYDKFPVEIKKVPWQTYPGHVPCPIVDNRKLPYQWSANEGNKELYSEYYYDYCKKNAIRNNFPKKLLNMSYVLFALLSHTLSFKDYSSEFKLFSTFHKYYNICGGEIVNLGR